MAGEELCDVLPDLHYMKEYNIQMLLLSLGFTSQTGSMVSVEARRRQESVSHSTALSHHSQHMITDVTERPLSTGMDRTDISQITALKMTPLLEKPTALRERTRTREGERKKEGGGRERETVMYCTLTSSILFLPVLCSKEVQCIIVVHTHTHTERERENGWAIQQTGEIIPERSDSPSSLT